MDTNVTRLFHSYPEAAKAVDELERTGIASDRISLMANNSEGHFQESSDQRHDDDHDKDGDAGNTKRGATTGGLIGGGVGLAAGLGALAIPGVGPVVAAGWLVSTAAGAVAGALGGGVTGGLVDAFKNNGHSDEDSQVYAEGVRRGGAVVSVKAPDADEVQRIEQIFSTLSGDDVHQRGTAYRDTGWSSFDASAPEYSREDIQRERGLYSR